MYCVLCSAVLVDDNSSTPSIPASRQIPCILDSFGPAEPFHASSAAPRVEIYHPTYLPTHPIHIGPRGPQLLRCPPDHQPSPCTCFARSIHPTCQPPWHTPHLALRAVVQRAPLLSCTSHHPLSPAGYMALPTTYLHLQDLIILSYPIPICPHQCCRISSGNASLLPPRLPLLLPHGPERPQYQHLRLSPLPLRAALRLSG